MSIPGKLLVIDDKFDEILPMLTELTRYGVPLVYWDPNSVVKPSTTNVRIVLTDINLLGLENVTRDSYDDVAAKLKDIPGPLIVVFVSVNYDEDESPRMLAQAYYDVTGNRFPGIIIGTNFEKTDPRAALADVPNKLGQVLASQKLFSAILWAESILNQGTDNILSDLTRREFGPAVKALLKSIVDDTGIESAAREFVMVLSRLLTRNLSTAKGYSELKTLLDELMRSGSITANPAQESVIYNKRMYYVPDTSEKPWTGDIYRTDSAEPFRQFAVLITPSCDISQDKVGYYKFAYGIAVTEADLSSNANHPLFVLDKALGRDAKKAVQKYLHRKGSVPPRLYPLNHFLDDSSDQSRTLVVDFQAVESLTPEALGSKHWVRLYRLDSPFAEDLLQKYGSHSFRLGTPSVTE